MNDRAGRVRAFPVRMLMGIGMAWLATACGTGDGSPGAAGGELGTLDGPDVLLDWQVDTVATLSGSEAPEWAAVQDVTAMDFDGEGRLYILDGPGRRIVVVDSMGEYGGTLGSPGEGPGEFRFPSGMGVSGEGTVFVHDAGHRAILVFDSTGVFRDQHPLDGEGWVPAGALRALEDRVAFAARPPGSAALDASAAEGDATSRDDRAVAVFLPPDSVAVVYRGWAPPVPLGRPLTEEETGGFRVRLPPLLGFHPDLHVAALPQGDLAVVDSTTWSIRILSPEGSPRVTLTRPLSPVEVTGEVREAERARRTAELLADPPRMVVNRREGGSATVADDPVLRLERARIEAMGFHDVIPVVRSMAADPQGRLWVERYAVPPATAGPMDVVTPDGSYVGTIPPGRFSMPAAFGPDGLLATVSADEFGAPRVHILRLR